MSTVILKYPIQANGREVTELELRRPTVKDMKEVERMKLDPNAEVAEWVKRLGAIPASSVDTIDASDFLRLCEVVDSFFRPSLLTGPSTSSGSPSGTAGVPATSKT